MQKHNVYHHLFRGWIQWRLLNMKKLIEFAADKRLHNLALSWFKVSIVQTHPAIDTELYGEILLDEVMSIYQQTTAVALGYVGPVLSINRPRLLASFKDSHSYQSPKLLYRFPTISVIVLVFRYNCRLSSAHLDISLITADPSIGLYDTC